MNIHKNARLTLHGRVHLIGLTAGIGVSTAAEAMGISVRTAYKWQSRFDQGGVAALVDASSRPDHSPKKLSPRLASRVRRLRRWCHWTMRRIARSLQISLSSVWRLCKAFNLSRLRPPAEPVCRYEHERPGDLLHMDTKKMACIGGRGSGYQVMHVAIDDHSRIAFVQILPDETKMSAVAFLNATVTYFERHRIHFKKLITDNGSAYWSHDFAQACAEHDIAHIFTRPHRPQTNGKAERFIQTWLREWLYVRHYPTNQHRTNALRPWLKFYNTERPHSALDGQPPITRARTTS